MYSTWAEPGSVLKSGFKHLILFRFTVPNKLFWPYTRTGFRKVSAFHDKAMFKILKHKKCGHDQLNKKSEKGQKQN